jgi:hypothetical protein
MDQTQRDAGKNPRRHYAADSLLFSSCRAPEEDELSQALERGAGGGRVAGPAMA